MKKRLLSALLALALVFVLLPTTALAGVTTESNYDISIDGKRYKFDSDGSGGYTTAYYQENNGKTPTSNYEDVWQTNPYLEITRVDNIITITVKIGSKGPGKSVTIGASTQDINYKCIAVNGAIDLIITGDTGTSLTLNKTYCGAALSATEGNITITDGVKVTASFKNKAVGNYVFYAIWAKNLTVSGANTEVTASGNCEDAIHVSGTVTVSKGAKLTATNDHNDRYKPYPITKSSAINSNVLTIADENSCVIAQAIDSLYGKPLRIQNYNIAGAIVKAGSSNYYSTETTIDKIDGNIYVKISVPALQTTSDVSIAGESAVVGVETKIPTANGSGTYFYDQASKTLTLKDVNITSGTNAIKFTDAGTYTVNLEGTNTISNVSRGILAKSANQNITGNINVILSGSGSLDISAKGRAIEVPSGNLTFNNTGAITLATTNTTVDDMNAIKVSGDISVGSDFNKNLKITTDNGDFMLGVSDLKSLNECKTITIAPKSSETRYNGTAMKYGETKPAGNGTISCDENGVITLNGVTEGTLEFRSSSDSTLVLEGTNTLSSIVTTQKGLTISGSGSLTVGSIRVTNNYNIHADLTITDGAKVTAGTTTSDAKAIDITGNLTVNSGATLTATNTSETNPTIDVTGNVTISGNGTNEYTVSAHNSYNVQKDRDGHLSPSGVPSAIKIGGTLKISAGARVMAQTDSYGAGVMLGLNSTITVEDAFLSAKNSSCDFAAISFSGHMGDIYVSGAKGEIVAENTHTNIGQSLAHKAINAFVYNRNTDFNLKMQSEGVKEEAKNKIIAPDGHDASGGKKVTITRGDAYETPQVAANYTIAGQAMYVGQYYKTDANGNITDGTAQDYNIYCDSENDFTLNNATISSTGTSGSTGVIMTNLNYSSAQFHIKLIGTNSINNAGHHAILGEGAYSTIIIENAENASNASLTISGNYLPVYSYGNVTINAEVVIKNTNGNLISTIKGGHANGAFDLGSGYKCYASTDVSGSPLETYDAAKSSTYKYLCVTTKTLETGGGSTHQHTWDTTKWYSVGDDYHARKCTGCDEYDLTNKQAHYAWPDEDKGPEGHTEKCMLCDYKYDQSVIKPHEWTGWWVSDYQPEVHAQRCNCGYQGSTHRTLKYVAINSEQHQKQCPVDGCDYKLEYTTTSHVYEEGSNICTECGYDKSAPCDHTGDRAYTNNGDGTHKVTCKACGATLFEKQNHEFDPATGACVCGATQSGGDPTPDNPGTIVIIRPAEEEKPAQQPNPSTGANDLVGLAVAAAVAAALGSAALLRKHD